MAQKENKALPESVGLFFARTKFGGSSRLVPRLKGVIYENRNFCPEMATNRVQFAEHPIFRADHDRSCR
jgi:hypothetical protein